MISLVEVVAARVGVGVVRMIVKIITEEVAVVAWAIALIVVISEQAEVGQARGNVAPVLPLNVGIVMIASLPLTLQQPLYNN